MIPTHQQSLKRKLLLSHLSLAGIGLVVLLAALASIWFLQNTSLRFALESQPKMELGDHIAAEVRGTFMQLRAWLDEKNEKYRQTRKETWQTDIFPALDELGRLVDSDPKARDIYIALKDELIRLEDLQANIEEVALSPQNRPANTLYERDWVPLANRIKENLAKISGIELELGHSDSELSQNIAQTNYNFIQAWLLLNSYLEEPSPILKSQIQRAIQESRKTLHGKGATAAQKALLERLILDFQHAQTAVEQVMDLRETTVKDQAAYLLHEYSIPLESSIAERLHQLEVMFTAEVRADAAESVRISQISMAVVLGLIVVMIILAVVLSIRGAERLLEPIMALRAAANRFGEGDLQEGIPEIFEDELGDLTKSFNHMRVRLLESYGRLEAILQAAAEGIISLDSQGRICAINHSAAMILGYPLVEMKEQPFERFLEVKSGLALKKALQSLLSGEQQAHHGLELLAFSPEGILIPLQISMSVVPISGSERIVGIFRDVSAEQRLRQSLIQARDEALSAEKLKSSFLANMSHEIRTPMNGIIGMTELCLKTELTPTQTRYIKAAHAGAKSLLTLLNDILDLSKLEGNKMDLEEIEFNLANLIKEVVENFVVEAQKKQLDLHACLDPVLPARYLGDPTRIRQVLLNLVGNAVKFTQAGWVALLVHGSQSQEGTYQLTLTIQDTGIGIPLDRQDKIFESFTQSDSSTSRKYGGTGLGMTIAKELIELMHGSIRLVSEEGRGTQVIIDLPLQAAEQLPTRPVEPGAKIVVLAHLDHQRESYGLLLHQWGHEVTLVQQPEKLIETIQQVEPDLLLLDTYQPKQDLISIYYDLAKLSSFNSMSLLFVYSTATPIHLSELDIFQQEKVLFQPFRPEELQQALRQLLAMQSPPERLASPPEPTGVVKAAPKVLEGTRILIVEDEILNQIMMEKWLTDRGLVCQIAADGKEALRLLPVFQPELILMDAHMPNLDGYETTTEIRRQGLLVPIIGTTAADSHSEQKEFLKAGVNEVLAKPINPQVLLQHIGQLLALQPKDGAASHPEKSHLAAPWAPVGVDMATALNKWGSEEALQKALEMFLRQHTGAPERLLSYLEVKDWMHLGSSTHALVGALGAISHNDLERLGRSLEKSVKDNDYERAKQLTLEFCQVLESFLEQLKANRHAASIVKPRSKGNENLGVILRKAKDSLARGEGLKAQEILDPYQEALRGVVPPLLVKRLWEEIEDFDFSKALSTLDEILILNQG